MSQENTQAPAGPIFNIQKIYVKDLSFETPNSPAVFQMDWKPDVHIDMQSTVAELDQHFFEVVLKLTVTVKVEDKVAFLAESHQAGIFTLSGFEEAQQQHLLGSICPNILYPYARESIGDLVTKGGFPQLILAPVNFEALYREHLERAEAEQAEPATA